MRSLSKSLSPSTPALPCKMSLPAADLTKPHGPQHQLFTPLLARCVRFPPIRNTNDGTKPRQNQISARMGTLHHSSLQASLAPHVVVNMAPLTAPPVTLLVLTVGARATGPRERSAPPNPPSADSVKGWVIMTSAVAPRLLLLPRPRPPHPHEQLKPVYGRTTLRLQMTALPRPSVSMSSMVPFPTSCTCYPTQERTLP